MLRTKAYIFKLITKNILKIKTLPESLQRECQLTQEFD